MVTNNSSNIPTGASGTVLQGQGVGSALAFTTATYPATTTINQILYSSGTNTVSEITTAIDGVLITSHTGVPSILANSGTPGWVLTANAGAPPSWQVTGGSGITTLNGDSGSATGATVTIKAGQSTQICGSTVSFTGSGATVALTLHDANTNMLVGFDSGNGSVVGGSNTAFGIAALQRLTSGSNNTIVGQSAGNGLTTGNRNTVMGSAALNITTGNTNIAIGNAAGTSYISSESGNICIGNSGTAAESHVIRIGTQGAGDGQQNLCFIAGITGVSVANLNMVTIDTSTGQLGSQGISAIMTWSDSSGAFGAVSGHGYFITTTSTPTLPASPSEGDTIAFIVDTANICTITGNTGQKIRLGTTISAAAGTCVNNVQGDSITLVYRTTGTTWIGQCAVGTWTIT